MKRVADYIGERDKWVCSKSALDGELKEAKQDRARLFADLVELTDAQYQVYPDVSRWRLVVDELFPELCRVAEIQCGRAELEINETLYIGKLLYTGIDFVIDDTLFNLWETITRIIKEADFFEISASKNRFVFEFMFLLTTHIQVKDESRQIEEMRQKLVSLMMESFEKQE